MTLHCQNVTVNLGNREILHRVTMSLGSGVTGLLGPNGAGKTTLLRVTATVLKASEGVIRVDGVDVAQDPREARRRLGYLPQHFSYLPRFTAR